MLLDVSAVTDGLLGLISNSWSTAPIWTELGSGSMFTPAFTGLAPDAIRSGGGAQLSLFLYHVESDNTQQAAFWAPQMLTDSGPPVSYMPLALNMFYLLSAYSEGNYAQEQQAMSAALQIFNANAIVQSDANANTEWYLTLTMEHRSYDELSRLWQATTVPLRLSVVYRAAVAFLSAQDPGASAKQVTTLNAHVNVTGASGADDAVTLTGTCDEPASS